MKILIINHFGIGDVLFTTPVLYNLRLAYPQADITYLANRRTQEFLCQNPSISKVLVYERDEFVEVYRKNPLASYAKWFALFKEIKADQFDIVLDFSLNTTFSFLTMICGIPRRIGFDYRHRGRFLTDKIPLEGFEGKHVVEHYLDLLKPLNVPITDKHMRLDIPSKEIQWAKDWVKSHHLDSNKPIICVVPGGGSSWGAAGRFRRWSVDKYAVLIDKIIEKFDAAVILLGNKNEEELYRDIARQVKFPLYSAIGQTTILQMAALFKQSRLAVINDGGSMHVAAACGIKIVCVFGPVDALIYGPYPSKDYTIVHKNLACQPCYRRFRLAQCQHVSCLRDLSVDEVFQQVAL